jgi:antitoxin VapB
MPLNIRSDTVNRLAEALASRLRLTKTEAVKLALENELHRLEHGVPLRDRLRAIQERIRKRPPTGLPADKNFYDDLSGPV